MSERSFRRAQERRRATEARRTELRRRRTGIAAGAAVGATVLFAPGVAQAADLEVNSTADAAADTCDPVGTGNGCTLRDAFETAQTESVRDTITFAPGLTGTIRLTEGELSMTNINGLTVTGPGRGVITVSGDANNDQTANSGDSRILTTSTPVSISGLTLDNGFASGDGGAIDAAGDLTITDSAISNSQATGFGGGIAATGSLALTNTNLSDNAAANGAGVAHTANAGAVTVDGGEITGNQASSEGGGIYNAIGSSLNLVTVKNGAKIEDNTAQSQGGGIFSEQAVSVTASTISGNTATSEGGGLWVESISGGSGPSKYSTFAQLNVADSVISDNHAADGGGLVHSTRRDKYGSAIKSVISGTTISGNTATGVGAGIEFAGGTGGDSFDISRSTISGNTGAGSSFGGGIGISNTGNLTVESSTLSGNVAAHGGGASLGTGSVSPTGTVDFANSTVASNRATVAGGGGGLFLSRYAAAPTASLDSALVGDNSAAGTAQDLASGGSTAGGGFDLSYSLVEKPGSAPVTQTPAASSILGVDPKLGPLASNGGPTKTHLPATSSPAIDQGDSPARLTTDQRGLARRVDNPPANKADGTDIGAVELPKFGAAGSGGSGAGGTGGSTGTRGPRCGGRPATIVAKPGQTTVGTSGDDVIVGTSGHDVIRGGGGNDVICARGGDDSVSGGDGNDRISGGGGKDRLSGNGDRDRISGNSGNDRISGGDDRDRLNGGDGNDRISGGRGKDSLSGGKGRDRLGGGSGNDRLSGSGGNDRLSGDSGNDRLSGDTGNDRLYGKSGKDRLSGTSGKDRLSGGSGNDRMSGGRGDDRLSGNSGDDHLSGNSGDDHLNGGSGDDLMSGGSGKDVFHGGPGQDQPEADQTS